MCKTGKESFKTFEQAKKAAQRMRRNYYTPIQPYKCDLCQTFHIGSRNTKYQKRWG